MRGSEVRFLFPAPFFGCCAARLRRWILLRDDRVLYVRSRLLSKIRLALEPLATPKNFQLTTRIPGEGLPKTAVLKSRDFRLQSADACNQSALNYRAMSVAEKYYILRAKFQSFLLHLPMTETSGCSNTHPESCH